MKMKTKESIFMLVWFALYIVATQFWRFKFGIFKISAASIIIGILLFWVFTRLNKPKSN